MNNNLELYHNILFIECPWLNHSISEKKFQELLHSVSKENYNQQPLYEVAFKKPLTPKRKYYHALIDNEAKRYLNTIHSLVGQASNDNEKKFWAHTTLAKKLKQKFTDIEKIIKAKKFQLTAIDNTQIDAKHRDDAFIIQFLKYQLIRLYLEIQNSYPAYLKEESLTEEDIYSAYFSEEAPQKSFIVTAPDHNLPKPATSIIITKEKTLNVIKGDIREIAKGVLKYSDAVANPDKFASFESELFNQGLIDDKYKFKKLRGQVQELAAVYHVLMRKNYFHKFHFPGKKKVTGLHIRKFLNHRYLANIDKEFRNFTDKTSLESYIESKPWLSLIIPS